MNEWIIRGGRVIDPSAGIFEKRNLWLKDGRIFMVYGPDEVPEGSLGVPEFDADGMWVMPGLIDLHVHFRDPGLTYKETVATGSRAAAAGGFTVVCAMPNTKPVTDTPEIVEYVKNEGEKAGLTRVLPIGAVTVGQIGKEMTDYAALKAAGACAVSEAGRSVADAGLMKRAMIACREAGMPIFDHCEEEKLAGGVMNEGEVSRKRGLKGLSRDAENTMTAREILLAASTGAQLHICHVSTKECVEMIRFAKAQGIPVTAEVGPHHFSLTDEAFLEELHSKYKMNPPLRTPADVEVMKQGLADGTIDAIATDHAPHSAEEKTADVVKSANGIIGLETAFAVSKTVLVDGGVLTPLELVEKMSLNPARILGLPLGTLSEGARADICIADPEESYVVGEEFHSKASNSPYVGKTLTGRVKATFFGGRPVYNNGKIVEEDR